MITQSPTSLKITELAQGIDILEESVRSLDRELLNILLYDRTTRKNIIWATTDYISYGPEFGELCEITPELVTGKYADLIQPRITKSQSARLGRTRDKAEVFTISSFNHSFCVGRIIKKIERNEQYVCSIRGKSDNLKSMQNKQGR